MYYYSCHALEMNIEENNKITGTCFSVSVNIVLVYTYVTVCIDDHHRTMVIKKKERK